MTDATEVGPGFELLGSDPAGRRVQDTLADLLAGDGTVYLVAGFFTYNGYRSLREDVRAFLERSRENELHLVVGASADQFSPRISRDLLAMDEHGQVSVHKVRRGLHAKLYLRDGPAPHVIVGSANLTKVAFEYNVELGVELRGADGERARIRPFVDWAEALVAGAEPMRRRDLAFPVQIWNAVLNWTNKGRLLPARYVAKRVTPIALLLALTAAVVWAI